jgi:hypothetical protein
MKIERIFIVLLLVLFGINFYTISKEVQRFDTALAVLDERVVRSEDNVKNVIDYVDNTVTDVSEVELRLMEEISKSKSLQQRMIDMFTGHIHEPVFIEAEEEEIIEEETNETLERIYDPVTQLHIPTISSIPVDPIEVEPTIETMEEVIEAIPPVVVSCPKVNNRLGRYIENIRINRDYKFIIDYDVKDNQVTNVEFSTNLPSTLQRAMVKYLNSFQMYGDTTGCSLSIKILEN